MNLKRKEEIFLVSHMAKANNQWQDFNSENKIMVVFSEPHANISTSFYVEKESVPTWNYVAVHGYGFPVILESDEEKKQVLEKMILAFNPPDLKKYGELSEHYISKMLKGIVAFEIKIEDLQGKFKMSQNRKPEEIQNIIAEFEKSDDAMIRKVGDQIKKSYQDG